MFDRLQDKLLAALKKMARSGRLSEADVEAGLREIRLALLEADVNLAVVRDFIARVRPRAVGADVLASLSPVEMLTKIVHDELTEMLGGADFDPRFHFGSGQYVIMLAGLQGSGKTTTAAKLAQRFKSEGKRPLLIAADLSRPAAVEQLKLLGQQAHTPVHSGSGDPVALVREGVALAAKQGLTPVIVDTAGRLAIDEALMDELAAVKAAVAPQDTLLVLDALTGQDAVETAKRFEERIGLTGLVLTKLDGDARGGAALSMRAVTGRPVRLVGISEKLEGLEYFHPARMAGRILGRGDMLSLIEKAVSSVDEDEALRLDKKLRREKKFDLEDFLTAMRQARKMGSMRQLLGFIPGLRITDEQLQQGQTEMRRFEAIVQSMTPAERRDPALLNASRRVRIANGSGTTVQDINRFVSQFREMQKMTGALLKRGQGQS
jgi:signal recognition particle subunit SRP54